MQIVITPAGKNLSPLLHYPRWQVNLSLAEFFTANDGTWHSLYWSGTMGRPDAYRTATASTLGKVANGVADNMLITTYMSMKAPMNDSTRYGLGYVCPSCNYSQFRFFSSYGNIIIEPACGELTKPFDRQGADGNLRKYYLLLRTFQSTRNSFKKKK